jgi:hypothetical protein
MTDLDQDRVDKGLAYVGSEIDGQVAKGDSRRIKRID